MVDEEAALEADSTERQEVTLLRSIDGRLKQLIMLLGGVPGEESAENALLQTILVTLQDFESKWIAANTPPPAFAVTGRVSVQGGQMGLTVDSTGQNLKFQFDDDHGDIVAPPTGDGSGLVVTLASDNAAVASVGPTTVGTDAAGNAEYTAPLAFGVDGSFNGSCLVANTSGAALMDDDGTTDFVQPAPVAVTVAAGQATTGTVTEG